MFVLVTHTQTHVRTHTHVKRGENDSPNQSFKLHFILYFTNKNIRTKIDVLFYVLIIMPSENLRLRYLTLKIPPFLITYILFCVFFQSLRPGDK